MFKYLDDIWSKASNLQRTLIVSFLPLVLCVYFFVTEVDVTAWLTSKNVAMHELDKHNAIDSVKRGMWHMFRTHIDSVQDYYENQLDSLKNYIDELKTNYNINE